MRAFPGASGFNVQMIRGGRGGQVRVVSTLSDGGSGSLRWALDAPGPVSVVFNVSGEIVIESALRVRGGTTIAAQTAPGDGVMIRCARAYGGPAVVVEGDDVIIRFLRVRRGEHSEPAVSGDALVVNGASNVLIDHSSFAFGTDEVCSTYNAHNVSFTHCIVSHGLVNSTHAEGSHSMGFLGGRTTNVALHQVVLAASVARNPQIQPVAQDGVADLRNVLVQNCNSSMAVFVYGVGESGGCHFVNLLSCRVRVADFSRRGLRIKAYDNGSVCLFDDGASVYVDDATRPFLSASHTTLRASEASLPAAAERPPLVPVDQLDAYLAAHAGAVRPRRDALDQAIVDAIFANRDVPYVNGSSARLIMPVFAVGARNSLDSDGDGVPDYFEVQALGTDPRNASDGASIDAASGYSQLERYLNSQQLLGSSEYVPFVNAPFLAEETTMTTTATTTTEVAVTTTQTSTDAASNDSTSNTSENLLQLSSLPFYV